MRLQTLNFDLESKQREPVTFLKPTSSYLENGGTIEIPHPLDSLYHEVELAVVIAKKARDVPESTAMEYVGGKYCFHSLSCLVDRYIIFAYSLFLLLLKDTRLLLICPLGKSKLPPR